MKTGTTLIGAITLACLTTGALAQAGDTFEGGPHKGAKELSVLGNISFGNGFTSGTVAGSVGYYLSDRFELGPTVSLNFASVGGSSETTGTVGGFTKYRLQLGRTSPYVGLDFLTTVGSGNSVQYIAPAVGVDFFFRPQQSFFVEYQLQIVTSGGGSGTLSNINFGLRFFLK